KPGATLTGAADKAAIAAVLAAVQKQTGVASVTNPFGQLPRVSGNGRIAVATVPKGAFVALEAAGAPARAAGLEVQYGGPVVDIQNQDSNDTADMIGIIVAVVILLFLFGTLLAAILPIGVALLAVAASSMTLLL